MTSSGPAYVVCKLRVYCLLWQKLMTVTTVPHWNSNSSRWPYPIDNRPEFDRPTYGGRGETTTVAEISVATTTFEETTSEAMALGTAFVEVDLRKSAVSTTSQAGPPGRHTAVSVLRGTGPRSGRSTSLSEPHAPPNHNPLHHLRRQRGRHTICLVNDRPVREFLLL